MTFIGNVRSAFSRRMIGKPQFGRNSGPTGRPDDRTIASEAWRHERRHRPYRRRADWDRLVRFQPNRRACPEWAFSLHGRLARCTLLIDANAKPLASRGRRLPHDQGEPLSESIDRHGVRGLSFTLTGNVFYNKIDTGSPAAMGSRSTISGSAKPRSTTSQPATTPSSLAPPIPASA